MKIAHLSDIHACSRGIDEVCKVFDYAVDVCIAREIDVMVIAGDLWDRTIDVTDKSALYPIMRIMKKAASRFPILLVYGTLSHDQPGSLDVFVEMDTKYPIYVSNEAEIVRYVSKKAEVEGKGSVMYPLSDKTIGRVLTEEGLSMEDGGGCLFYTMPGMKKSSVVRELIERGMSGNDSEIGDFVRSILKTYGMIGEEIGHGIPKIFVGHITVAGSSLGNGQVLIGADVEISKGDLLMANADYYALGHIHNHEQPALPENMKYCGGLWHTDFGSIGEKGFWLVEFGRQADVGSADVLARVEWIRVPAVPVVTHDVMLINGENPYHLEKACEGEAKARYRYYVNPSDNRVIDKARVMALLVKMYGEHRHKIERHVVPVERSRVDDHDWHGACLRDKVKMWGVAMKRDVSEGVLEKADAVEQEIEL